MVSRVGGKSVVSHADVYGWADLLWLAQMTHSAIFRINNRVVLAEMSWDAMFWGHA